MPVCLVCKKRAYSEYCVQHKPRKSLTRTPIKVVGKGKPPGQRYIERHGKEHRKWLKTKADWLKVHTYPVHRCHYCGTSIGVSQLTLDHKIPRSRAPELRYDFDNLVPCCWTCNGLKGSVAHDDYKHNCHL